MNSKLTDEEMKLIQLPQLTPVGTESNKVSATQKVSTEQSGGVTLQEVDPDEMNNTQE